MKPRGEDRLTGRPPLTGRTEEEKVDGAEPILSIRLNEAMRRDLDEVALGFRVPVSEVVRMAVEHALRIWMGREVRDPGRTVNVLPHEKPKRGPKRRTKSGR